MTQGVHDVPFAFVVEFKRLNEQLDMKANRIEITTTSGNRFWVKALTEEWEDAIRFIAENSDKPQFLMKHTIELMGAVNRPH
jgi:hypothetical protein